MNVHPSLGFSEVPMSVMVSKSMEPKRDSEGAFLSRWRFSIKSVESDQRTSDLTFVRSLLGKPEDYYEMRLSEIGKTEEDLLVEERKAAKEVQEQEDYMRQVEKKKRQVKIFNHCRSSMCLKTTGRERKTETFSGNANFYENAISQTRESFTALEWNVRRVG